MFRIADGETHDTDGVDVVAQKIRIIRQRQCVNQPTFLTEGAWLSLAKVGPSVALVAASGQGSLMPTPIHGDVGHIGFDH